MNVAKQDDLTIPDAAHDPRNISELQQWIHSYIFSDKVPSAIRNYGPWDFTIISTIAHNGILTRKCPNFPGLFRLATWNFTAIPDLGRLFSTPWDTEWWFTVFYPLGLMCNAHPNKKLICACLISFSIWINWIFTQSFFKGDNFWKFNIEWLVEWTRVQLSNETHFISDLFKFD